MGLLLLQSVCLLVDCSFLWLKRWCWILLLLVVVLVVLLLS